MAKAVL